MVSSSRATSSEDPPTLKWARCSEETGEGLWGCAGCLSPAPLSSVGSSLGSGSESKPKAGMSYSGSSYLSFSGESRLSLAPAGPSSASLGLLGGAGGGTLGLVSVLVRRLRLGFLRLSMYDAGAQPSFSPICTYHQPPEFLSMTWGNRMGRLVSWEDCWTLNCAELTASYFGFSRHYFHFTDEQIKPLSKWPRTQYGEGWPRIQTQGSIISWLRGLPSPRLFLLVSQVSINTVI